MPKIALNPEFSYGAAGICKKDIKVQTINAEMKVITRVVFL